ncbi:hypothetical protein EYF80_049944 [Liparis tanakae]|uniref:Uncharacterized protein n=1 Tax=Liparis tanakae TaxID=230148 RepID=A0A4Z2FG20_9TELE|nr:hypothetical protein EYF80_049944 [Liparis tanakae]
MPVHALVTRRPRGPEPAAALAGDGVTWSGQRPPGGTLTLLAVATWHPWVTVITSSAPRQVDHAEKDRAAHDASTSLKRVASDWKDDAVIAFLMLSGAEEAFPFGWKDID